MGWLTLEQAPVKERVAAAREVRDAQAVFLAAEARRKAAVRAGRAAGLRWSQIGGACGISGQAARKLALSGTARRKATS